MTTKPKAKKFRIRRSGAVAASGTAPAAPATGDEARAARAEMAAQAARAAQQARANRRAASGGAAGTADTAPAQPAAETGNVRKLNQMEELAAGGTDDGFPEGRMPTARRGQVESPQELSAEADIDAIKREGLTGRQLRMARRLAQKHGLPATSDFDAVRLLRRQGIDPFQRSTMLEIVNNGGEAEGGEGRVQLPQTVPSGKGKPQLPSTKVMDVAERARSVMEIQRDIARRRRRKLALLATKLAFFVLLPTVIAGYYYAEIATPMYATKSEFVIQKADASSPALSSLFSGSGLATSQDSITVQSYLSSRDAMLRLDQDLGFKEHFSDPSIDAIQRLPADASNEQAYKLYSRNVKIGYDPTEGIIKMEVVAASPELSAAFSQALINYAEERVDNLTQRLREDQMKGAVESYREAEDQMMAAQEEVLRLQEEMGVFDATSDAGAIMGQVNSFEIQLQQKRLQLQQLLDNAEPNQARVSGLEGEIGRLEVLIEDLRAKLTETGAGGTDSLAKVSGELTIAQTNMQTRTLLMQQALQQLETARIEANKQTRYLSMGVHPVAPDDPSYPRVFENTVLAFLIFMGIYLMMSLTASILREQVSG